MHVSSSVADAAPAPAAGPAVVRRLDCAGPLLCGRCRACGLAARAWLRTALRTSLTDGR